MWVCLNMFVCCALTFFFCVCACLMVCVCLSMRLRSTVCTCVCVCDPKGLTQSQPCMGYCLNVMRGCLASVAEIDPLWRDFVRSLEGLSARMYGPQDLEQVLLGAPMLLHDAVTYAQGNAPYLTAQVCVCVCVCACVCVFYRLF